MHLNGPEKLLGIIRPTFFSLILALILTLILDFFALSHVRFAYFRSSNMVNLH